MKKKLKVIYTKSGLANNFGTHIELNKKLKKDKELKNFVLRHELGHKKEFDLNHEIKDGIFLLTKPKVAFKLLYLYFTTPSTWTDILPIQVRKKHIVYDLNLLILYIIAISLGYLLLRLIL